MASGNIDHHDRLDSPAQSLSQISADILKYSQLYTFLKQLLYYTGDGWRHSYELWLKVHNGQPGPVEHNTNHPPPILGRLLDALESKEGIELELIKALQKHTNEELDNACEHLLSIASNEFLDRCFDKRLQTVDDAKLVQALNKAKRLGLGQAHISLERRPRHELPSHHSMQHPKSGNRSESEAERYGPGTGPAENTASHRVGVTRAWPARESSQQHMGSKRAAPTTRCPSGCDNRAKRRQTGRINAHLAAHETNQNQPVGACVSTGSILERTVIDLTAEEA